MGVPPGSGVRMGIDRDADGVLDGDVPPPSVQIAQSAGNAMLNWPYSAAGFGIQSAPVLSPGAWTNVPEPWEIISNRNYVTEPAVGTRYYRLRYPYP